MRPDLCRVCGMIGTMDRLRTMAARVSLALFGALVFKLALLLAPAVWPTPETRFLAEIAASQCLPNYGQGEDQQSNLPDESCCILCTATVVAGAPPPPPVLPVPRLAPVDFTFTLAPAPDTVGQRRAELSPIAARAPPRRA